MKRCEKCKISVRGSVSRCPLCQTPLSGTDDGERNYPEILKTYRHYKFVFKVIVFTMLILAVVSVAVNMILPETGRWSVAVVVGMICLWISMFFAVRQRHSLPKNITWQAFFMSVFCIIMDYLTNWHGWSLDYTAPFIFMVAMISMAVIAIVVDLPVNEYLVCLILDIIFGLVPIVFYCLDMLNHRIPSVLCISCSIICLAGLVIFQGEAILRELARRFHI